MFKKVAIAAAVFALAAAPVLAKGVSGSSQSNSNMGVHNVVVTVANTGLNLTGGSSGEGRDHRVGTSVSTGDASALSVVGNQVGTNSSACGCSTGRGSSSSQSNSKMGVMNLTVTVANSGANMTTGGSVKTGNAGAESDVTNVVGSNMSGVSAS